jgi:hypothetical protein
LISFLGATSSGAAAIRAFKISKAGWHFVVLVLVLEKNRRWAIAAKEGCFLIPNYNLQKRSYGGIRN